MKPLPSRVESFVAGLILGMLLAWSIAPARAEGAGAIEHWGGVTLGSRHFTADNEKYCESNPGIFYERRWADGARGFHAGYYRNSFCKAERDDRIDDTFYALAIYQPWRVWGCRCCTSPRWERLMACSRRGRSGIAPTFRCCSSFRPWPGARR